MYGKPPHGPQDKNRIQELSDQQEDEFLRGIKEHDLLLMSNEELDLKGQDIKKIISPEWLMQLSLNNPSVMLGFVVERSKKGSNSIELHVDINKREILEK